MFIPLCAGHEVIQIPNFKPEMMDDLVLKYKPNHIIGVPSFFERLAKSKKIKNKDLSFLLCNITGGDQLLESTEKLINDFLHSHNCKYDILKGYGMTEMGSAVTVTATDECNILGSVGIPSHSAVVKVIDHDTGAELWNSVEVNEKGDSAQLARTYRVELPNEWTYELATDVMREYVKRNFVDKGMCAQFAIHDSENKKTGQRNLHCHILLTMRGIDEHGNWMPKQKKVYLTDDNGERIPVIDKKTGQQKVDKQNRKQWKCTTVSTNDWSSKENAKIWRKDITDTINKVNSQMGMTENFWEHRSFKEQGLDVIPQIHLGEKASAMERAGVHTIRGDINRDIIARNAIIEAARAVYDKAREELEAIRAIPVTVVKAIKNEIIDMIREVAKRNNNRLNLPIMGSKYIRHISDRRGLQDKEFLEQYVEKKGFTSFEDLKDFKSENEQRYSEITSQRNDANERISYLKDLLTVYDQYEPFIKNNKEYWSLKGFAHKNYERMHKVELVKYNVLREKLKDMIREPDKKITATKWRNELESLLAKKEELKLPYAEAVTNLACCEILEHNRKELLRMLQNEERKCKDLNKNIDLER